MHRNELTRWSTLNPFHSGVSNVPLFASTYFASNPWIGAESACSVPALPTIIKGFFAALNFFANSPSPATRVLQRLRVCAEVVVPIGKLHALADEANLERCVQPALADARVKHGRLVSRVGADKQDDVGLLDARDS